MIKLTPQQQEAVASTGEVPLCILDPGTDTKYVLVRADIYDRVRQILDLDENQFVRDLTPHVMEVFGRAGWDDPAMDIYNDLDPRIKPELTSP